MFIFCLIFYLYLSDVAVLLAVLLGGASELGIRGQDAELQSASRLSCQATHSQGSGIRSYKKFSIKSDILTKPIRH